MSLKSKDRPFSITTDSKLKKKLKDSPANQIHSSSAPIKQRKRRSVEKIKKQMSNLEGNLKLYKKSESFRLASKSESPKRTHYKSDYMNSRIIQHHDQNGTMQSTQLKKNKEIGDVWINRLEAERRDINNKSQRKTLIEEKLEKSTTESMKKTEILKASPIRSRDFYLNRHKTERQFVDNKEAGQSRHLEENQKSKKLKLTLGSEKSIGKKIKQNVTIDKNVKYKLYDKKEKQSNDVYKKQLKERTEKETRSYVAKKSHKPNKSNVSTGKPKKNVDLEKQLKEPTQNQLVKSLGMHSEKPHINPVHEKYEKQQDNEIIDSSDTTDSEDEVHSIIERFRKKRKNFLENLKKTQNTTGNIHYTTPKRKMNNELMKMKLQDMFVEENELGPKKENKGLPVAQKLPVENNNKPQPNKIDDDEGYLRVKEGDIIDGRYFVKSILGKGVYSNVVHALDHSNNIEMAIKIIRNNELMLKLSLREILYLKKISDVKGETYCVKYYSHFLHKGHLCLVLEAMPMNLRTYLKKNGKNGLDTRCVSIFSKQLFTALNVLKKLSLIHADIKPDNILVNDQKNLVKLCDFGSATRNCDNEPVEYLVSRYYRAPEVILGIPYTNAIDTWATACTIYEMSTGKILFVGKKNNKMLKCFIELKGKFPVQMIQRGKFKDQHFNSKNKFLLHIHGEYGKRKRTVEVINDAPVRDLLYELRHYNRKIFIDDKKIKQLKDLLDKMLTLDPEARISPEDCLKHEFVKDC